MTLTDADLDYLERNARKMTPGPRGCEAGEPVPGERFYVTGPTPGIPDDLQDGVFGEVLMSAEHHGDAVVAAFLTQERVLALVSLARQAPRGVPGVEPDALGELRDAWEHAKFIPGVMVPPSLAWAILRVLGDVQETGPSEPPRGRRL
jgi:hypothetical protein